jgi:hypothetical protein
MRPGLCCRWANLRAITAGMLECSSSQPRAAASIYPAIVNRLELVLDTGKMSRE